jgi:hypothetical protein
MGLLVSDDPHTYAVTVLMRLCRRCLLRAGVGHGELLESYMDAFRRWQGKKALLQLSSSAAAVTLDWAKICAGYDRNVLNCSKYFICELIFCLLTGTVPSTRWTPASL